MFFTGENLHVGRYAFRYVKKFMIFYDRIDDILVRIGVKFFKVKQWLTSYIKLRNFCLQIKDGEIIKRAFISEIT